MKYWRHGTDRTIFFGTGNICNHTLSNARTDPSTPSLHTAALSGDSRGAVFASNAAWRCFDGDICK